VKCPITEFTSTVIRCTLAAGKGYDQTVVVTSIFDSSSTYTLLSYGAPIVASVSGCQYDNSSLSTSNCDRNGGQSLTLVCCCPLSINPPDVFLQSLMYDHIDW
jgi:hypothetical protein